MTVPIHSHYSIIYCLYSICFTKWQFYPSHTIRLPVSRKLHNRISKHLGVYLTAFDGNIPLLSEALLWDH